MHSPSCRVECSLGAHIGTRSMIGGRARPTRLGTLNVRDRARGRGETRGRRVARASSRLRSCRNGVTFAPSVARDCQTNVTLVRTHARPRRRASLIHTCTHTNAHARCARVLRQRGNVMIARASVSTTDTRDRGNLRMPLLLRREWQPQLLATAVTSAAHASRTIEALEWGCVLSAILKCVHS